MTERTLLLFSGLLLLHYVAAQGPKTAWQAGGVGMGVAVRPTTSPPDPTDHQINIALMNINNAKTEVQAAKAAAAIFSPTLDMSDNVKQAVETKVRQLRTPPGWVHPIPPPLPFGFDVMNLIMGAYYGTATEPPAGAAIPAMPMMGANMGPPTTIVRGPSPSKRNAGRGRRVGFGSGQSFHQPSISLQQGGFQWSGRAGSLADPTTVFPPSTNDWMNLFTNNALWK